MRLERRPHAVDFLGGTAKHYPEYPQPRAIYKSSQPWAGETVDVTALYIMAAGKYAEKTSGRKWFEAKINKQSLDAAGRWLLQRKNHTGLITEGLVAGWADFNLRAGNVSYTNIITCKAFEMLGWHEQAQSLKSAIDMHLWDKNRGYFIEGISPKGKRQTDFCADANTLAVGLDIATREQAASVMNFIEENGLNTIPVATYYPHKRLKRDWWGKILFPHYDGSEKVFMWWGGWEAVAQMAVGEKEKAIRDFNTYAQIFNKLKTCPEAVDRTNGSAEKTLLYQPGEGMTWSAGVLLYGAAYLGFL